MLWPPSMLNWTNVLICYFGSTTWLVKEDKLYASLRRYDTIRYRRVFVYTGIWGTWAGTAPGVYWYGRVEYLSQKQHYIIIASIKHRLDWHTCQAVSFLQLSWYSQKLGQGEIFAPIAEHTTKSSALLTQSNNAHAYSPCYAKPTHGNSTTICDHE
jgi:hypothetical protein